VARPDPVWAPFPLTEIAIAVGIVLFALGYVASADRSPALLGGGALVLVVSVGELCLREHFAGFRSHSILLALLPVIAAHTLVVYGPRRRGRVRSRSSLTSRSRRCSRGICTGASRSRRRVRASDAERSVSALQAS